MPSARQKLGKSHNDLRDETRGLILASAQNLFIEKGYSDTTMQMIAKEAGVSRSSLYRNFESKWDVAKPIVESVWPSWEEMWTNAPFHDGATLEEISQWLRSMLDLLRQAKSYIFLTRVIEAIEPEASSIMLEVNNRILEILSKGNQAGFSTANASGSGYYFDQMFLMQLNQFFYSSMRTLWDASDDAPVDAMARHMKAFIAARAPSDKASQPQTGGVRPVHNP